MELQWPLILFTSFIAASAGLFCVQGIYAIAGKGEKAQKTATIVSLILLVVGGIAVFFHLEHWERIFNGFGHITSGITQELIFIVIMFIVMILFFVFLRREGKIAKWLGILAIVSAVALLFVVGHSYMMASRPAWNNILQILSIIGAAAAIGAGLFALLDAKEEEDAKLHGLANIIGTVANLVFTGAFVATMASATKGLTTVGNHFDATHPTYGMVDPSALSPFAGSSAGLTWAAIILAVIAVVLAFVGKKNNKWAVMGAAIAACAFIGAILLRVVFYTAGGSVFLFY